MGDLPVVRQAASHFPQQASGFFMSGGHLYQIAVTPVYVQAGSEPGLLNVLVTGYTVDDAGRRPFERSHRRQRIRVPVRR